MPLTNAGQRVTAGQESLNAVLGNDQSTFTVTQASLRDLCNGWTVPGGDASTGTFYEVFIWGNGVWGSPVEALTLQMTFGGSSFGSGGNQTIASNVFSAGIAFRWQAKLSLMCISTGAGGTWHGSAFFCVTQSANNVNPGTDSQNTVPVVAGPSTPVAMDTTVDSVLKLQVSWNATTGSPTISSQGSIFYRWGG